MNAIEDNEFHRCLRQVALRLPRPQAIVCISAHWETDGVRVTASPSPETIHDFYGFPRALHEARYQAPGHPDLASRIAELLPGGAHLDETRGFDHGCWGVLLPMYPDAQVPVVQLSLDRRIPMLRHYELARSLRPLRQEGILLIGSGNIVHNLARIDLTASEGAPWAVRCNDQVKQYIADDDVQSLANFASSDPDALLSMPTPEHFLPLLYVLGVRGADDSIQWFNDTTAMGSVSMTSLVLAS